MGSRGSSDRARPVGDAPVGELTVAAPELTKGWLLAQLDAAPLEALPAQIPAALATEGPELCAAMARALADDGALERLAADPVAARAGGLVGAGDVEGVLRAIEALRRVLWAAVREARPRAAGEEVAQLADRLASVVEVVRGAALLGAAIEPAAAEPVAEPEPAAAEPVAAEPVAEPEPPAEPDADGEPARDAEPDPGAEPEPIARPALESVPEAEPVATRGPGRVPDPGPALWQRALADEVEVAIQAGTPLSLLHIELTDADRMRAAAPAEEVAGVVGQFTQAIRGVVRRQDILARESDARMWVIARETGRSGAQALGRRAVASVAAATPWRGAPLEAAVGVAVLREDARDAEGLIAAAEEACFAAAAAGSGVEDRPLGG